MSNIERLCRAMERHCALTEEQIRELKYTNALLEGIALSNRVEPLVSSYGRNAHVPEPYDDGWPEYDAVPPTRMVPMRTRFLLRGKGQPKPYPLNDECGPELAVAPSDYIDAGKEGLLDEEPPPYDFPDDLESFGDYESEGA